MNRRATAVIDIASCLSISHFLVWIIRLLICSGVWRTICILYTIQLVPLPIGCKRPKVEKLTMCFQTWARQTRKFETSLTSFWFDLTTSSSFKLCYYSINLIDIVSVGIFPPHNAQCSLLIGPQEQPYVFWLVNTGVVSKIAFKLIQTLVFDFGWVERK